MNVFLDDDRYSIKEVSWIKYPEELQLATWIHVKTYDEFRDLVIKRGIPKVVSFDHDLDWTAYMAYTESLLTGTIDYNKIKKETGLHAAMWLIEYCDIKDVPLPTCFSHSHNPIGYRNIRRILTENGCDATVGVEEGFK